MTDPRPFPPVPAAAAASPAAAGPVKANPAAASPPSAVPAPPRWDPAAPPPTSGLISVPSAPPPPVLDPAGVSLRGRAAQPRSEQTTTPPVDVHSSGGSGPGAAPAATDTPARRIRVIGDRGRLAGVYFVTLVAVLLAAGGLVLTLAGAVTHRGPAGAWLLFAVLLAAAITGHRAANQAASAGQNAEPVTPPAGPAGPSNR